MKTNEIVEWLRGYSVAKKMLGEEDAADMILLAANKLERTDRSLRVARAERDRAWAELARIKGEFERERISSD